MWLQGSDSKHTERGRDEIFTSYADYPETVLVFDNLITEWQTGHWILGAGNIGGGQEPCLMEMVVITRQGISSPDSRLQDPRAY